MKTLALAIVLGLATSRGAAFGQAGGLLDMIWYPDVRVTGDIGLDYRLYGAAGGDYYYSGYKFTQDYTFDTMYDMTSPGIGGVVMVGGELFAIGGYLNAQNGSRYIAGVGMGGTLFWVGKMLIELGYSGSIDPIQVPSGWTLSGGPYIPPNVPSVTYTYSTESPGGLFLGIDLGAEVPIVIVPDLYVSVLYRFFTMLIEMPLTTSDPHNQGYWLARDSICVGLSYKIGPGWAVPF